MSTIPPTTALKRRRGATPFFRALLATPVLLAAIHPAAADIPFSGRLLADNDAFGASSVGVADVDGDGDLDLLSSALHDDSVKWYENDGAQGFTVHTVTTAADGATDVEAADLDGDGDMDLVVSSFNDSTIAWYENDSSQAFTAHPIFTAASGAREVAVADLDGDGDLDVLSASEQDHTVAWYENDGSQGFTTRVISSSASRVRSVRAVDLDRDGDLDVLVAALGDNAVLWFENDGAQGFTRHAVAVTLPVEASAADIDGDGDLDLISVSAFANQIAWHENDGAQGFTLRVVDDDATWAQSAAAGDIDGDGDMDLAGAAYNADLVAWYENDGAQGFTRRVLSVVSDGAAAVAVADLDGDGDLEVAAATQVGDTVEWFENRALHRSAVFAAAVPVTTGASEPRSLRLADLDGDGDLDALRSSASGPRVSWYENGGVEEGAWNQHVVSASLGYQDSLAADLDGDGDLDVAALSDGTLAWFENSGGGATSWTDHVLVTTLDDAVSVAAADLDRDGDLDLLAASRGDGTVHLFENTAGDGSAWSASVLTSSVPGVTWVGAADVDGDGDLDAVSSSFSGRSITWHENAAGDAGTWVDRSVSTTAGLVRSLTIADLDGDGDPDIAATENGLDWYENTDGDGSAWALRSLPFLQDTRDTFLADLDGDGDLDVLAVSGTNNQALWFENLAGDASAWSSRPIADLGLPLLVTAGDLDRDGDLDVLIAASGEQALSAFTNRGGQFALATEDVAPLRAGAERLDPLLAVEAAHRGRPGDGDLALATFELLFESAPGLPLTTAELSALVAQLAVFRDDGSGSFEPGTDLQVASQTAFDLADGVLELSLPSGDPELQVGFGGPATYYLAATWEAEAAAQDPETLRVTHRTASSSTAVHAEGGGALRLESSPEVSSSVVEINDPPVAQSDPAQALDEDDSVSVAAPGVLANDSDEEGDLLEALLTSPPAAAASFELAADGSYVYVPAEHFSGTDSFTYQAWDGLDASAPVVIELVVAAVADAPQLAARGASGRPDEPLDLVIIAALTDDDGSEALTVTLSGLPAGASLSAGTDAGGGVWTLLPADLEGLQLLPPTGFEGSFDLSLTATATEAANGDTAEATATLPVILAAAIFTDGFESGDTSAWSGSIP